MSNYDGMSAEDKALLDGLGDGTFVKTPELRISQPNTEKSEARKGQLYLLQDGEDAWHESWRQSVTVTPLHISSKRSTAFGVTPSCYSFDGKKPHEKSACLSPTCVTLAAGKLIVDCNEAQKGGDCKHSMVLKAVLADVGMIEITFGGTSVFALKDIQRAAAGGNLHDIQVELVTEKIKNNANYRYRLNSHGASELDVAVQLNELREQQERKDAKAAEGNIPF